MTLSGLLKATPPSTSDGSEPRTARLTTPRPTIAHFIDEETEDQNG